MPASNIDFTALTDVIHFSVIPNTDGTLNSGENGLTPGNSADIVTRAHAAGKPVLLCVGGAGSESDFELATTNATLSTFVSNLTNFMAARGYDGVDIDWEPLTVADGPQFTNLVYRLRSALNNFPQYKLLTVAAGAYPPYGDPPTGEYTMFAALQSQFDQINIMTYDLSGPYEGWVTWFNSPIYDGGYRFPSSGALVPSVNGAVSNFVVNGVSPAKLGIGMAFYGDIWAGGSGTSTGGVTQPRQSWTNAPTLSNATYTAIMSSYYQSSLYHWDTQCPGCLSQYYQCRSRRRYVHFLRRSTHLPIQSQLCPQPGAGRGDDLGTRPGPSERTDRSFAPGGQTGIGYARSNCHSKDRSRH